MIKITAPIELKTGTFSIRDRGFNERIRDNYALIGSGITAETLTHVLHTPPEILVAEGSESVTNIGGNAFSFTNVQQTLINNAVNRILISGDYALNYQDRVFITTVLNKLGIKDERTFMSEVRDILSETSNTLKLTGLYMENAVEIRNLIEYEKAGRPAPRRSSRKEKEADRFDNRLWYNIMNRLQTGMIYQIVENLNMSSDRNTVVQTEVNNSEQSYTARQLLLQRYRNATVDAEVPFVYRADNVFEEETRDDDIKTVDRVKEIVNSAAFLEVIRSLDHVYALKTESDRRYWSDYSESFYGTADNVLSRILIEARENRSFVKYENTALSFVNNAQIREINALTGIIEEKERSDEAFSEALTEYYDSYYEEGPETETETVDTRSESYRESVTDSRREFSSSEMQLLERRENETNEEYRERIEKLASENSRIREYLETRESTASLRSERRSEASSEREFERSEMRLFERLENETLSENLERINSNNRENLERYRELRRILLTESKTTARTSDRERTIRESIKSLSDREHLMKLLENIDKEETVSTDRKLEQIYRILPAETVAVLKQLEARGTGSTDNTVAVTEAALAESQINDYVTEEREYAPADIVYEPERTDGEEEYATYDESEITREIASRVLKETGLLQTVGLFEDFITTQLNREMFSVYEAERLSRMGNSPAEMEFLENIIEGAGRSRSITDRFTENRREFRRISDMIHKIDETLSEEDVMERLEEFRRQTAKEKVNITTETPDIHTEFKNIQPVSSPQTNPFAIDRERQEEIAELVERGVRSRLNMISTEVYARLEKRLKSEKARRGY